MQQKIREIAVYLAIILFFVVASISGFCGCSPSVCAGRSLIAALVMYVVTMLAGRLIFRILLQTIVDSKIEKNTPGDNQL